MRQRTIVNKDTVFSSEITEEDSVDREEKEASAVTNLEGYTKLAEKDQEYLCKPGSDHDTSEDEGFCNKNNEVTLASSTRGSYNKDSRELQVIAIKSILEVFVVAAMGIKEALAEWK